MNAKTELVKTRSYGQWLTIYTHAGIKFKGNPAKHQACPCCGGRDRFRMDNRRSMGDWICNLCGNGNGFDLLMAVRGDTFGQAINYVAGVLGVSDDKNIDQKKLSKEVELAKQKSADNEKARLFAEAEAQRQVAIISEKKWNMAIQAPLEHWYLVKKQISAHIARVNQKGDLLIPMFTSNGFCNMQTIYTDGAKRFERGGLIKGAYCLIGKQTEMPVVLIAEGYSTCASIYEATQIPVAVAFTAGNLLAVAKNIQNRFGDDIQLVFCADNDIATAHKQRQRDIDAGKKPKPLDDYNTGLAKARSAAVTMGGLLVIPTSP